MNKRNTFVAVCFRTEDDGPESAYAMDYCLCKDGGNRVSGRIEFAPRRLGLHESKGTFPVVFQRWYGETFEKWNLPTGRLPVVIGWGSRDRKIFDFLLEDDNITLITQSISYLDVKAYALGSNRVKGCRASDGWRKIASRIELLEQQYADLDEPTPRAVVEMFFALENSGDSAVIAKAFLDIVKVIMADGKITTDEAKLLRSFISTLLGKQPRFNDLARELDGILADNVVDEKESKRLVRILKGMRSDFAAGEENRQ